MSVSESPYDAAVRKRAFDKRQAKAQAMRRGNDGVGYYELAPGYFWSSDVTFYVAARSSGEAWRIYSRRERR